MQARRFLAQRGWPHHRLASNRPAAAATVAPRPSDSSGSTAVWTPLGPKAVISPSYGLVTGRVSSIAIDASDPTGKRVVFVGTTGGGVWASQLADASTPLVFKPLTDTPDALSAVRDASISIGAITVQPGGNGVILAGTGDPNDALDSYYGSGVLRSADGGNTWTLMSHTADQICSFQGEAFAGFAWANPQLVVAAVSQAYEGTLVNAQLSGVSCAGLYYSTDAGATWSLATVTDSPGQDVQGARDMFSPNSATAVVWNPIRSRFIAAVRFHGYYESADGINWTRIPTQPGAGLTPKACPTNPGSLGSLKCPILRGSLAANPITGDTFAWTVDIADQDQGIGQDPCAISDGVCSNQTVGFSQQWSTASLDSDTALGPATVANGDYNLVLAAVPSGQDTLLFAGDNDLWRCSLAAGCTWRNTTHAVSCMSATVAPYQHSLAWNSSNPKEIFLGNDSGLWQSPDAVAEMDADCSATDSSHFNNLNGSLGSLAEVESMSLGSSSPHAIMAGLGVNGTAGVNSTLDPLPDDWPQILGGQGGSVAIDPANPDNWYANNSAGVSIHLCALAGNCTPDAFGAAAVVSDSDVGGDGSSINSPAAFIVDPLDNTQLLVATCRIWRGSPDGTAWTSANAISPILDDVTGSGPCNGNALIRSIAAFPVDRGEVVYAGMFGSLDGGVDLAGHVFRAVYNPANGTPPIWQDLTTNPVINNAHSFNYYGFDISSIVVDPHDKTGNTFYVTVAGIPDPQHLIRMLYQSADGGAHWTELSSNLPISPANSVVVDPQDANTVYLATDSGVYSTRQISSCSVRANNCWSLFGTGLPYAPVVQLSASIPDILVAGTYGRGIWQIPLWTAGTQLTMASADPTSLTFASQPVGSTSTSQIITLTNTGSVALSVSSIAATVGFAETDNCRASPVSPGATCAIQVTFRPAQTGDISAQLTISLNVAGGQITVPLSGTGTSAAGPVTVTPVSLVFGQVPLGATSSLRTVTVENATSLSVPITSLSLTPPFNLLANACGTSVAPNSSCTITITFQPTQAGPASGTLTLIDGAGTQTVTLSGTGTAFDFSLAFSGSSSQTVSSGQTAGYSATLTTLGSEGGAFTFSCGGLPAYSSCAFSPASETIPANASGPVTVQITTSKSSSTARDSLPASDRTFGRTGRIFPLACVLMVLPATFFRRPWKRIYLLAFFAVVFCSITSCAGAGGGGGGAPPASSGTPAGTYRITMTAGANEVSHQLTLTLIVK